MKADIVRFIALDIPIPGVEQKSPKLALDWNEPILYISLWNLAIVFEIKGPKDTQE